MQLVFCVSDVELPTEDLRVLLAEHMANVHLSIDSANERFLREERRHNYTTPKSFLELIAFYKQFLERKRKEADLSIARLQKGLTTLKETTAEVEGLREDLKEKMAVADEKKAAADALVEQVLKASAIADEEAVIANTEKDKANQLSEEAAAIQQKADEELSEAMPAMERAREAVKCLTKPAIQVHLHNLNLSTALYSIIQYYASDTEFDTPSEDEVLQYTEKQVNTCLKQKQHDNMLILF